MNECIAKYLDDALKVCEAATPERWERPDSSYISMIREGERVRNIAMAPGCTASPERWDADAIFITSSRNHRPKELKALRKAIEELVQISYSAYRSGVDKDIAIYALKDIEKILCGDEK
jgi:hypothetical protein